MLRHCAERQTRALQSRRTWRFWYLAVGPGYFLKLVQLFGQDCWLRRNAISFSRLSIYKALGGGWNATTAGQTVPTANTVSEQDLAGAGG